LNAALYPEFILQSIWYDELPPQQGAVWGGVPPANVWNKLALHGAVRNLLGRPSTVAYRTDASQPFHYITRSYDERGRVECILRLTENIGYDAVYYAYNSSNSIISVHVVDARGQHATFYGYDQEGRVCKTWTRSSADGFGPFMEPRRPKLLTLERDGVSQQPVAEYQYNLLNQVSLVTYPKISVTTTNTYNAAGALLRSTTQQGQRPYYDEAFSYSRGGMITDKFFTQDGESRHETYGYDQAARLTGVVEHFWPSDPRYSMQLKQQSFVYDRASNRLEHLRQSNVGQPYSFNELHYAHTPGTNQLTRVSDVPMVNGVTAGNPTFDDVLTYDPDGSMISRTIGFRFQVSGVRYSRIEAVPLRRSRPSAAKLPLHGEAVPPRRSRKALAWVYTLVGADGRQLATYNGLQGSMCGRNGVRLWPVEFNTYGPNNTRIITRADGTSEVVISDYLGSARITLSTTAEPLQSSSYHPYGTERTSTGSGARTSYIGREHDKETDLGFYGVRLYEPEYGRFLSTDVLWGKHLSRQPYHYALNNPVTNFDFTGLDSNQRAIIVSAAEDYLGSGSTYQMGSKGQPGKPVDCSGLVNNCLVKAGEQSTLSRKDLSGGTGVERIEKSGEKVPVEAVVPGNVVTFRTGGSWSYHTGVVVVVRKGEDGKVQQMDFIHSSSKNNGPVKSTINFLLPNSFWTKSINGFFKVDTKPETTSNGQSKKSTESGSNTNESLPKTGG